MHKDVFLALAALDSYNRGSNYGLDMRAYSKIGNALIKYQLDEAGEDYFSVAYELEDAIGTLVNGTTIVSYRGTDNYYNDFMTAWTGGVGDPYTEQAQHAASFYQYVKPLTTGPLILTGHSSGGGLAGLIASIYHEDAVIFANMAYQLAASNTYSNSSSANNPAQIVLRDNFYGTASPWAPDFTGVKTISVNGEILELNRVFQTGTKETLDFVDPLDFNPLIDVELHSAALHVLVTYGHAETNLDPWLGAARPMYEALRSNEIGEHIGVVGLEGRYNNSDKMMSIIAYSALSEGVRPFGDTAIRALFDDAGDLAVGISAETDEIDLLEDLLAEVFVEYAGLLAINAIEDVTQTAAKNGVLSLSEDETHLSVDLSDSTWTFDNVVKSPLNREDLIAKSVGSGSEFEQLTATALAWYAEKTGQSAADLYSLVKALTVQLAFGADVALPTLATDLRMYVLTDISQHVVFPDGGRGFVVGTNGNDMISAGGGIDIIVGKDGIDTLDGGDGDDWIVGGADSDTISGGAGNDEIWGGSHDDESSSDGDVDTVDYSAVTAPISIEFLGGWGLTVYDGQAGTDTLHSIEKIIGTTGRDTVRVYGEIAAGTKLLIDANGGQSPSPADTINLRGAAGDTILSLNSSGAGYIKSVSTNGKIDLVNFHTSIIGSGSADTITDLASGPKRIDGGGGDDIISVAGVTASAILIGGEGSDHLTGGAGNDTISGSGGSPYYDGADTLVGGAGNDFFYINSNSDTIFGGEGSDYVLLAQQEYPDDIHIHGGEGNDVIDLKTGASFWVTTYFSPGDGHDTILHTIDTDGGRLLIDAGWGDVSFIYYGRITHTVVDGWSLDGDYDLDYMIGDLVIVINSTGDSILIKGVLGISPNILSDSLGVGDYVVGRAVVSAFPQIDIRFSDGAHFLYYNPGGNGVQAASTASYDVAEAEYATAIQNSFDNGTAAADDIQGTSTDDEIEALGGDDFISASAGSDTVNGGDGTDTISFFGSYLDFDWFVEGGKLLVKSLVLGGVTELTEVEHVYFISDDLTLSVIDLIGTLGTEGNDTIVGTILDDELEGLGGNDSLRGGWGNDYLDGGDGTDVATYLGSSVDFLIYYDFDGQLYVSDQSYAEGYDRLSNVEALYFTADDQTVTISSIAPLGTASDDVIIGSSRVDLLYGLEGNDDLSGGLANDILDGGAGSDALAGGGGDDVYYVDDAGDVVSEAQGEGTDKIYSTVTWVLGSHIENLTLDGESNLTATGNELSNLLEGNSGDNLLFGGDGDDILWGYRGNDVLDGDDGNDQAIYYRSFEDFAIGRMPGGAISVIDLVGDDGADTLIEVETIGFDWDAVTIVVANLPALGTSGEDVLIGTARSDILYGLAGDDVFTGGSGNDVLDGGDGNDEAIFAGNLADYSIERQPDGTILVTSLASSEGVDTLVNMEGIVFADTVIATIDIPLI